MKKIAIMGGTFNPIHFGHLMISEYIKNDYRIDKVIFLPTGKPPHKKSIDANVRYEMVKLAIEDNKDFTISDIEVNNKSKSYSYDTIMKLKSVMDGKFYFIIGSDTLFQLKTWKKIKELSQEVEFICAIRPEYVSTKLLELELKYLNDLNGTIVHICETPLYEISSTDLRKRISKGYNLKYLIPDKVIDYINKNQLYRGNDE